MNWFLQKAGYTASKGQPAFGGLEMNQTSAAMRSAMAEPGSGPAASPDQAVAEAFEQLGKEPRQALEPVQRALQSSPDHPLALLVQGIAQRKLHEPMAAAATLRKLLLT